MKLQVGRLSIEGHFLALIVWFTICDEQISFLKVCLVADPRAAHALVYFKKRKTKQTSDRFARCKIRTESPPLYVELAAEKFLNQAFFAFIFFCCYHLKRMLRFITEKSFVHFCCQSFKSIGFNCGSRLGSLLGQKVLPAIHFMAK